jgi:hypothetical protein
LEKLEALERIVRIEAGFAPSNDDEEEISPEEEGHEVSPEEERRKRMDTALVRVVAQNGAGNLSRYEAAMMKVVAGTITLLHFIQTSRREAETGPGVIESVAIASRPKI